MAVEGVMVSYNYSEDGELANILTVSASGLRFSRRWVLTHGSILSPLKEAKVIQNAKGKPILSDAFYANLPEVHVTCEREKSARPSVYETVERLSRERDERELEHSSYQIRVMTGRIVHIWQCPILDRCVDDILYSWTIGHRDGDVESQTQLGKALLSVFVLVDLQSDDRGYKTLRPLSSLLDQVRPPPDRGSTVEVHSTPFGCEVFLNAVTRGSICGVVGKRPSLLLTDAATALGSEGGPVFTEGPTKELIGCVVCSVSWWRGEWVGLTLTAPLVSVLSAKLRVNAAPARNLASHPYREILDSIDKSTVLVRCGAAWGAGVYLGAGYVLTCAHVVRNYTISKVSIYCDGVQQTGIVRYKTADDKAYDLALLFTNPEHWTHLKAARFTSSAAEKGESVLAAGYPYFNETNLDQLRPTVTTGHVNNTSPSMIQTSCCVQSGFSGGPIFRVTKETNVEVVAIIVSNAKTQTGACYPYINMAVPADVFKHLVKDFITDKGLEVYSEFCGYCLATSQAIRRGKLELGLDSIAMAKKGHLTRAVFGSNGIELCRVIEEELQYMGHPEIKRPQFEIDEMLPEEAEKAELDIQIQKDVFEATERLRTLTLAARKRRVCNRLAQHVQRLNFILFWPHNHQAHYDLYEKWDMINIQVGAKDTFQLKEEDLKEVLYMSDVDANEACIHAMLDGECLVVLFKMFDTDNRDFVKLLRYALYEEIPVPKEDVPPEKQVPLIPAFERYATISKSARQVRRDRHNAKLKKLQDEKEEAERLAAEQARMERLAEEERLAAEKQRKEEEKMARIQAGLPAEPEPEPEPEGEQELVAEGEEKGEAETETDQAGLEEEKVEAEEEFNSDIEVEDEEYIPPGGLFVPGLYAPPNELAKANGLAFFYPKTIEKLATIESEHLPPHVLVMFSVDKREDVKEVIKQYQDEILAVGIFVGDDLTTAEHVAYSIKQYDKMERLRRHRDRLALMVSRKRSLPLLQLAGLNPFFISADVASGERDCLHLFPVGYGDSFEEEESIVEEEVPEFVPEPDPEPEHEEVEQPKDEDDDDEED